MRKEEITEYAKSAIARYTDNEK